MRIHISNNDHAELKKALAIIDTTTDPITHIMGACIWNQGEVATASGMHPATVKELRAGRKATRAQRAALKFAYLTRSLNI